MTGGLAIIDSPNRMGVAKARPLITHTGAVLRGIAGRFSDAYELAVFGNASAHTSMRAINHLYNSDWFIDQLAPIQFRAVDYSLDALFKSLATELKEEVLMSSSLMDIERSSSFKLILTLGNDAVRFILRDLADNKVDPFPWFKALRLLTKEDPARNAPRGNWSAMADAWIAWGHEHGKLA